MKCSKISRCLRVLVAAIPGFTGAAANLYTSGHGDIRPYYESGQLKVRFELDYSALVNGAEVGGSETGSVSFAIGNLVTQIPDNPFPMPDLSEFSFIGARPDEPLWFVPEVQESDRPWLGLSTEELKFGQWAGDVVRMSLASVTGPSGGAFSMFDSGDGVTPRIFMATSDGIDGKDQYSYQAGGELIAGMRVSTHAHVNWMFTQPGNYTVALQFSGTHHVDGAKTVIANLQFVVAVPVPTLTLQHTPTTGRMLTFPTVSGFVYRIERQMRLGTKEWSEWQRVAGNGRPYQITVDGPDVSQFFRVIVE